MPIFELSRTVDKSLHSSWQTIHHWTTFVRYCWQKPNAQLNLLQTALTVYMTELDYAWPAGGGQWFIRTEVYFKTGHLRVKKKKKKSKKSFNTFTTAKYAIQNKILFSLRGCTACWWFIRANQTTWHTSVHVVTNYPARGSWTKNVLNT